MKTRFASDIPVKATLSKEGVFWKLCHAELEKRGLFKNLPPFKEGSYFRYSEESLCAIFIETEELSGFKMEGPDFREEYYLKNQMFHTRICKESDEPPSSVPSLTQRAAKEFGGKDDDFIFIGGDGLHIWDEKYINELSDIFGKREEHKLKLPVIYLSRERWLGMPFLDHEKLTERFQGVAHVVLESDTWLSIKTRKETNVRLPYNGSVAISFPDGKVYKYDISSMTAEVLEERIWHDVIMRSIRFSSEYFSFTELENISLRLASGKLKSRLSSQIKELKSAEELKEELEEQKEYLSRVEELAEERRKENEEIRASYEEYIAALEAETTRLKQRLKGYEKSERGKGRTVSFSCPEKDLYPSEIHDYILSLLSREKKNLGSVSDISGRRSDAILTSLLSNNPESGERAAFREKLKNLFYGRKNFGSAERRELSSMGFVLSDDGKHTVLKLHGEERYMSVIAKTGSDSRGLKNAFTNIDNMLFR